MNLFKQFFKSLYSPKDIALFRFQGIGKTIGYVFLLTLLSVLPTIYFFGTTLKSGIETARPVIQNEFPSFKISDGQLKTNSNVPITVNKNNFTIIIDSTGAVSQTELSDRKDTLAFLKNKFVISGGGRIQAYPYSMLNQVKVSNKQLLDFIDGIENNITTIISVISVFIFLFACAASFVEVSVLAVIGLFLRNLTGKKLNYSQLWRMAAYSETLPTVFFTIMAVLQTKVQNEVLINWFVAAVVLLLSIKEIPKPKNKLD
ncbi:MAG: DUF1189 domain-containing protein [Bacillota bacterium]|nr:DUF1189 domain-containing protein [Bacillota bacterium]MDP4170311.1 DUF1189 domain-containing protein [Bacillota bacterium]